MVNCFHYHHFIVAPFIPQCKNSYPPAPSTCQQGARPLPTQQVPLHQAVLQRTWADRGRPTYTCNLCTYCSLNNEPSLERLCVCL